MTILCLYWNLSFFDRFVPQMKAISDYIGSFKIVYMYGLPRKEWKLEFERVDPPYNVGGKTVSWALSITKIAKQLKKLAPDLIYSLSGFMWVGRISGTRSLGVPYVYRLRGDFLRENSLKYGWFRRKIFNWIDQTNLQYATLVIPISSRLRQFALKLGVREELIAQPVPIGVDTVMFRPIKVKRDDRFTVAYAGRISPEKRILRLFKIAEKMKNIRFIVAGRLQMDACFPGNIEYFGELPFSEMPIFYNKADIIILPSVAEGWGNAVLEAYACGKAVLVAEGTLPEELKVYGSAVHVNNLESELEALRNSDLETIGEQARSYVKKHFSWEKFGRSIADHLLNVRARV